MRERETSRKSLKGKEKERRGKREREERGERKKEALLTLELASVCGYPEEKMLNCNSWLLDSVYTK